MSTLKDTTLAPPAAPDTTLGADAGAYLKPEIASPSPEAEYTPPIEEDLLSFARQEFDGNALFEERTAPATGMRAAELKRNKKLKKMLMAVAGAAVVGAITLGAGTIAPEPAPIPTPGGTDEPTPDVVEELSTIRQILSRYPNWYSAEFDVYLHFNEGVGWLYDHGEFHRILWTIDGEGSDDEHLVIETGYSYRSEEGWLETNEFTSELQVAATGDSFAISGVTGIAFHDNASTTFAPVDTIGVDSTVVDRFGAMTAQQIMEAIGTFAIHDPKNADDIMQYIGLAFSRGTITLMFEQTGSITVPVEYLGRLDGHFYTDEVVVRVSDGSDPFEPGRMPGIMVIREDGVYVYFMGLTMRMPPFLEFIAGSLPDGAAPEPVAPEAPETSVEVGDTIIFGSYEQDGNSANGPEPIEWRVLAVEEGRALVISVYGLDCMPFSARGDGNSWETSGLRSWLGGTFTAEAFTAEEQARIVEVTCLSVEEAAQYFESDVDRRCAPTAYALARGTWTYEGMCEWWLRSAGSRGALDRTAYVAPDGSIFAEGMRVYADTYAVRPAMWITL